MITIKEGQNELNVKLQAPAGVVSYGIIYYDGIPSNSWERVVSGCQVPTGVPIFLAPDWINSSSFNIVGHIDLIMDGTALTATKNQDKEATPGNGWMVQFSPVTLNAGTHTFVVRLSSGGMVLDTKTFILVAVAPTSLGDLSGVVTDATTYAPIQGVSVTLDSASMVTNASGQYAFTGIPPGNYSIQFSKAGYQTLTL